MKNKTAIFMLSFMTVCFIMPSAPLMGQENGQKTGSDTVQTVSKVEIKPYEGIVLLEENNNVPAENTEEEMYETAFEELSGKIDAINSIKDKHEWFLAYKSIVNDYDDMFDKPETIYDCFSENELELLFRVVQAEIGDEYTFEQKTNVANVIFNRLAHPDFPDSLLEILTPDQFASISDGRYLESEASETTILACEYAFAIGDTTGGCLFFDSNNTLNYEFVWNDGAHNFYTLKEEKKDGGGLILLQE